jgi:membrane peptidoglycan carboxypeptidase
MERRGRIGHKVRRPRKKGRFGQPAKRRSIKQLIGTVLIVLLALAFAGAVAIIIMFAWLSKDLPDPNNIKFRKLPQTTKIYDRTGETILYEVHGDQKRTVVELKDISPHVINATIAAEDRNFYEHGGFSLKGYIRAFIKNTLRGTLHGEGGSTITQQFVKNSILTGEKTYTRKAKELVLSMEMERRFSKDEILKLYLNEIPYGSVIYGIESAAQSYFGKSSKDLTLSEAALLSSIPKAATYYSPFGTHRKQLIQRSHYVINTMVELGTVTEDEAEEAKNDDALNRIKPRIDNILAPHFVFHVRELLAEKFGEQAESGGLKVITTLDVEKQTMAEETVTEKMEIVEEWGGSTAALLALDPRNSEILAMVGSADYFDDENNGKFNHVFGFLQPGSSIKPMVYAAAFEKGYTPNTVLYDVETVFAKYPREYKPRNYDGEVHGPVTVRKALAGSLNIPAVKMLYLVGLKTFSEQAKQLGYTTFNDPSRIGLSLVLGGGEVYPYEHISAYVVFPQKGYYREPKSILKVEDAEGVVIYDATTPSPAKRVISEQTTRTINSILSDNASRAYVFGESNYLTLGERPVCAKTGTTNLYKDAWTIGYTPYLLAGVWAGNSTGKPMKEGASSSKVAAPIWNAFMRKAVVKDPIIGFESPEDIVTGKAVLDGEASTAMKFKIDKMSGKLATENTPEDMIEEIEFSSPHSILHFIDKDDPQGEPPADPTSNPQYTFWEEAIAEWAEENEITLHPPPTEEDDIHVPDNAPSVRLQRPEDGATWSTRQVSLSVYATAPRGVSRVEYRLDGETMTIFESSPFGGTASVPNHFAKGFHKLTAIAYDDVGNRTETDPITINLTAEPGPIDLQWSNLNHYSRIYTGQFPYPVKIKLGDYKSVTKLTLSAIRSGSYSEEIIGTINNPPLPNISFNWSLPTTSGSYKLKAEATMTGGSVRSQELTVWVVQ